MNMQKDNKIIVFGLAAVVILAIIAIVTIPKEEKLNYEEMTEEEIVVAVEEEINDREIYELSTLGERERIERYISKFITFIEYGNYEDAYQLLNSEFKSNYFPTLTSFEDYAKTKFPKTCSLTHTNFERNGEVYVLWVTITSVSGSKDSGIDMTFVVKENDLNNFEMSFSVI